MKTVGEVYPSQWLHAGDLMKKSVAVTVETVDVQEFRQQDGKKASRIVVGFRGAQRKLVLNKTQAIAFAAIAGTEEFERWGGLRVLLSPGRASNGQETIIIGESE